MGKNKHKHKHSRDSDSPSPDSSPAHHGSTTTTATTTTSTFPRLIVKIGGMGGGGGSTPDRLSIGSGGGDSNGPTTQLGGSGGGHHPGLHISHGAASFQGGAAGGDGGGLSFSYHSNSNITAASNSSSITAVTTTSSGHRHKDKKKKKKKDKKKSHEKDKERDREHRHHHKKKKKKDYPDYPDYPEASHHPSTAYKPKLEVGGSTPEPPTLESCVEGAGGGGAGAVGGKRDYSAVAGGAGQESAAPQLHTEPPHKRFCGAGGQAGSLPPPSSSTPALEAGGSRPLAVLPANNGQPGIKVVLSGGTAVIPGSSSPAAAAYHPSAVPVGSGSPAAAAYHTTSGGQANCSPAAAAYHPTAVQRAQAAAPPPAPVVSGHRDPPLLSPKQEGGGRPLTPGGLARTPAQHNTSSPASSNNTSSTLNGTGKKRSPNLSNVLEHLLVMLEKKDASNFFGQPVSDTFAPGYSQIIKEPMDFSRMRAKIAEDRYDNLQSFRYDFELICNNCMTYNLPDTIYFKTAKKLHQQGLRILAPDRIRSLAEHLPLMKELSSVQLGFQLRDEAPAEMTPEDEKDVIRVIEEIRSNIRRPPGRFEAIPDNLTPEEVKKQVVSAAEAAAARLQKRRPGSQMGFLRQKPDGSTSLALVTPSSEGEKPVTLGQLIGRIKNGATALQGFKEDRRNVAKSVHPIYYGAFSSYGPAYDSTFANLTKQETELVYSTYGDDVGVSYAESIKTFSRNCEYATFIVDHLLDILTGHEHKKTTRHIEEQKLLRLEEETVRAAFEGGSSSSAGQTAAAVVDFDSLKSLADDGIDVSYLDSLQKHYTNYQASPAGRLESNAVLLESLRSVQSDRLSAQPPQFVGEAQGPSQAECQIAELVQANLVEIVGQTRPRDVFVQSSNRC